MSTQIAAPETVLIEAGPFTMGDDTGRPDERPAHTVTLSAFRIAVEPVTNADYAGFLAATDAEAPRFWADPKFNRLRQPVVGVTWADAAAYCDWLSELHGARYRLPTEAEWEKAARGGLEGKTWPWGDAIFDGSDGRFPMDATWDIGSARNPYGLVDIGFNIHEWCADWYDANYYAGSPARDPQGPSTGERRSSRGGAWRHAIKVCRSAARSSIPPDYRYNDYGFRVAREP